MTSDNFKLLEASVKSGILNDPDLFKLLRPYSASDDECKVFIKNCLKKMATRRMMLRLQWFSEIAEDVEKVRQNRPALKLIFLFSLAEGLVKQSIPKTTPSIKAFQIFFGHITMEDKNKLTRGFRRSLAARKMHSLRFTSIIKILYDVRNRAVHGEDFWSFSLLDKDEKEKHKEYTHYALLTHGWLGKKGKKQRVPLDITLTYDDLKDIIIRTAIENIKILF